MSIPLFYKESSIYNEVKNNSEKFVRDDSEIVDDDGLNEALYCLAYWKIEILPSHIFSYIMKNPFLPSLDLKINIILLELWRDQIKEEALRMFNEDLSYLMSIEDEELSIFLKKSIIKHNKSVKEFDFRVKIKSDGTLMCKQRKHNSHIRQSNLPTGKFIHLSSGMDFVSAIREDGTVFSWGDNWDDQCDNIPDGEFVYLDCGEDFTAAIRTDGTIAMWGYNICGQLNNIPTGKFIFLACGSDHTSAIREDGTVVTFGNNEYNYMLYM